MEGLHDNGFDDATIAAVQVAPDEVVLAPKEAALYALAEALTVAPAQSAGSVLAAKAAGWRDEELADAVLIAAYFNMLTRIADAFALPPDESHPYVPGATLPMLECGRKRP